MRVFACGTIVLFSFYVFIMSASSISKQKGMLCRSSLGLLAIFCLTQAY